MFGKQYKKESLSDIKHRILKKQLYKVFKEESLRLKYLIPVVIGCSSVGCQECQSGHAKTKTNITQN